MNQIKCSQSMSSLVSPEKYQRTPEGNCKKPSNRLCLSLSSKKSRRTFNKKMWRRSWGSYEERDVDEPMEENSRFVDNSEETMYEDTTADSSLCQFLEDYTEICDWLNDAQVQRGRSADATRLSELGAELLRRQPWRVKINESAKILLKSFPFLKEECGWRMRHLNSQWDALEKILLCQSHPVPTEVESKLKNGDTCGIEWLKEWLHEMENQLQPLDFRTQWTAELLQFQIGRHKDLQTEIETKSVKVHEALRSFGKRETAKKSRLEKRWWQLRLRVLEWVQHLAGIQDKICWEEEHPNKSTPREISWSSDEETAEPLSKYRRLGIGNLQNSNFSPNCGQFLAAEQTNLDLLALLDEEDVEMGQSHDVENFKRSPLSSSVVEFIFEDPPPPTNLSNSANSGSTSSVNSSANSSSSSSASGPSNNFGLKRKLDSPPQYYNKFEAFEKFDQMNVSTYYFKHSENKEMVGMTKFDSNTNTTTNKENESAEFFAKSEILPLDNCQLETVTNECTNFASLCPSTDMEPAPVVALIPLEKEIGELVQKAEELAKRRVDLSIFETSTKIGSSVSNKLSNFGGGDGSGSGSGGEDSAITKSATVRQTLSGSSSFASLKARFLKMEEVLAGAVGSTTVVSKGGVACAGGGAGKRVKKSARVRQWVREHNVGGVGGKDVLSRKVGRKQNPPTPSSCDASAESTSDEDSSSLLSSTSSPSASPSLNTSSSTVLLAQTASALVNIRQQNASKTLPLVQMRLRKLGNNSKPRPRSFTEYSQKFGQQKNWVASDTALNLYSQLEEQAQSDSSNSNSNSNSKKKRRERVVRKRLFKHKRRISSREDLLGPTTRASGDDDIPAQPAEQEAEPEKENKSPPRPLFQILGPVSTATNSTLQNNSDISSMNTEQDWDSYQEKYLSEPYSEEAYDPNDTLKLLAFGEDYGQYLNIADSESSALSGFEPGAGKGKWRGNNRRRKSKIPSDSDCEEVTNLLQQSSAQLCFIDAVFRKLVANPNHGNHAEFAELTSTCESNISSLQLILPQIHTNSKATTEILLENWTTLKEQLNQTMAENCLATRLSQIKEEIHDLKSDFSNVHSHFEEYSFDADNLSSLDSKIAHIQQMLQELSDRKLALQDLNEASLHTQLFLKDSKSGGVVKEQLNELYALYEENFQLGTYLLEKMRFLQVAWEKFEAEKSEFERLLAVGNLKAKLCKELSSAASTDSGHGTDASHDSSVSDSDLDFQEKKQKLDNLKKRAGEIKACLPVGSWRVVDVIERRVTEAEQGLEGLHSRRFGPEPELKIIYPKKRAQQLQRRPPPTSKYPPSNADKRRRPTKPGMSTSSPTLLTKSTTRKWKVVRRMVGLNFALMGLFLAAAYFMHPNCCEYSNTFCFSLVPHLTHESMPPI